MRVDELMQFLKRAMIDKKHPEAKVCFISSSGQVTDIDSVYLKDKTTLVLSTALVLPKEAD